MLSLRIGRRLLRVESHRSGMIENCNRMAQVLLFDQVNGIQDLRSCLAKERIL
jgi:hypothetical protein